MFTENSLSTVNINDTIPFLITQHPSNVGYLKRAASTDYVCLCYVYHMKWNEISYAIGLAL